MVKAVLEHTDSILSYGTEDLAQYKDLPQTTTKIVLGCAGAATNNPFLDSSAGYMEHCFVMRIAQFSQISGPTKLVLRSTKAQLDIGLQQPTKWCVLLYPNGNQPERQGFVSLYLYRSVSLFQQKHCKNICRRKNIFHRKKYLFQVGQADRTSCGNFQIFLVKLLQ